MKSKYILRAVALLMFCLSLAFAASAQRVEKAHGLGPNPCHESNRTCLQEINKKISQVRAYVKHVKPGDPVEFNPQPDPPGDPDPWYLEGRAAYKGLQEDCA